MRIAVASFMQESNSFSPLPTGRTAFERGYIHRGDAIVRVLAATRVECAGFLAELGRAGAQAVPLVAAYTMAGGPVERPVFEAILGEILVGLAAAAPLDGLLLALHGAMLTEDGDDADGEILARVRAALPAGTPIGVSLDLHGLITPRMLQPHTHLIGYKTYPHLDMAETGAKCARILLDTLRGRVAPRMALARRPMIVNPIAATTDAPALRQVRGLADAQPGMLDVSIFTVQPWLDVPDLGCSVLACADGDAAQARAVAERVADALWDARGAFEPALTPLDQAIAVGLAGPGLTVVSDAGDAPSGGAAADSAAVVRALIEAGADRAEATTLLTLCDPVVAATCHRHGVGARLTAPLGHHFSRKLGTPVAATFDVVSLASGRHRTGNGIMVDPGPCAVIAIGSIRVAVRSEPLFEWDPSVFTSQGLDPAAARLVFVKSPSHFRAAYAPIAARILVADTPGATVPNMRRIPFTRVAGPTDSP
ncbi:MAG: M81 family metallopeptidase [Alphaproteobacteria bacterium]